MTRHYPIIPYRSTLAFQRFVLIKTNRCLHIVTGKMEVVTPLSASWHNTGAYCHNFGFGRWLVKTLHFWWPTHPTLPAPVAAHLCVRKTLARSMFPAFLRNHPFLLYHKVWLWMRWDANSFVFPERRVEKLSTATLGIARGFSFPKWLADWQDSPQFQNGQVPATANKMEREAQEA